MTKWMYVRNDQIPLEKVDKYDKIILSPGPGLPEEAGLLLPLIKQLCIYQIHSGRLFGSSGNRRGFWWKVGESFHSLSWCGNACTYCTDRRQPVNTVNANLFNGLMTGLMLGAIIAG